jgi:hypothetical protein
MNRGWVIRSSVGEPPPGDREFWRRFVFTAVLHPEGDRFPPYLT